MFDRIRDSSFKYRNWRFSWLRRTIWSTKMPSQNPCSRQSRNYAVDIWQRILWLYGSRKISPRSINCRAVRWIGLLVASFRSSQFRSNEKCLILSITFQRALSSPVQINPAIFERSSDTQIETLIIRPLENACAVTKPDVVKDWPRLIAIDGLDERHVNGPLIQSAIIHSLFVAPQSHFSISSPAVPTHISDLHSIFWTNLVPLVTLS